MNCPIPVSSLQHPPPRAPHSPAPSEWRRRRVYARRAESERLRQAAASNHSLSAAWDLAPADGAGFEDQQQGAPRLGVVGWHHYGSSWFSDKGRAMGAGLAASAREAARFFGDASAFVEHECAARAVGPPPAGGTRPRRARRLRQDPGNAAVVGDAGTADVEAEGRREEEEIRAEGRRRAPPPAPAPGPPGPRGPAPFLCEEEVANALAAGACAGIVITGPPPRHMAAAAGGGGWGAGGDNSYEPGGGEGEEGGEGGAEGAAQGGAFDASLAWALRERGCVIVHIGPGAEAPAALVQRGGTGGGGADGAPVGGAPERRLSEEADGGAGAQDAPKLGGLIHIQGALAPAPAPLARPAGLTLSDAIREADAAAGYLLGLIPDLAHGEGARAAAARRADVRYALLQVSAGGDDAWGALAGLAAEERRGAAGGGTAAAAAAPGAGVGVGAMPGAPASFGGGWGLLARVDALVVESEEPPPPDHRSGGMYSMLYQRLGFLGYLHQPWGPRGLRLGWARRPAERAAAQAAVLGS